MRWLTPQERDFAPGRPGSIVVLADHSDSVSTETRMAISQALKGLRSRIPSARLFAFHADIEEVPEDRDFFGTFPPNGASRWAGRYANTTDLGYCLGRIAPLNPTKTILFSDGACRNKRNTLRVVERLTGSVDAFFCEPDPAHYDENYVTGHTAEQMFQILTRDVDEGLMQQIARCGRGRFVRFHPDRTNLTAELTFSTEERAPMRRRLPDYQVPGDQIDFVVPESRYVDARQHVHVQHGTVVEHHYAPVEHRHHGQAHQQTVVIAPTEVQVKRRGFWASVLLGPQEQAVPQTQQEQFRGTLQAQPAQAGLPPPQARRAPTTLQEVLSMFNAGLLTKEEAQHYDRLLRGTTLAISHKPEQPMGSAAASFNAKTKVAR